MTDKQIMIDGVDVSGCKGFYIHDRSTTNIDYWMYGQCKSSKEYGCYCRNNPNCYFKQLARKTQECEQIKEKYEALKLENQEGYEIVAELKHECKELKKEIINKNEKIKELRFSVSDLTNRLCYLNAEKSFRIVDLEQALDEIKSICLKDVHTFADGTQLRYDSLDDILDIISKAKGDINEAII